MGRFTVYSKDGQTVRCVLDKLEYTGVFMAERACTSTFISDVKINFDVFDYIDYRGERFELELLPTVKKISKHQYSYDLNFVSLKYELERCMMRNIVPSDNGIVYPTPLVVEFTGTVKYLAERIQACLDAMYGKDIWSITLAEGVDSEEKNISMSNQNCWSALSLVNTEYKLNYFVKGRSVTIGGAEPVVNNVFEYGKGKGLYEIERISDADTGVVTKLRAYGGTRNLDYSYPKRPEWTDSILPANYALSPLRLMLPSFKTDGKTDFVLASEEAIAKYGIREGVMTYDDIYPSITGMKNSSGQAIDEIKSVSAITSETQPTFTVQLYDLGFDLEESYMPEAQLSMKSGALQGYAFTITKIVKASDGSYTLTLGRNSLEEADTDNFTVPNKDWNMKAGDKFVLLNILMPQEYIRAAENRLLERAKEYLAKYSSTNYSYNIGVDELFMARNANFYNEIMEGKRLTVNDPEMGIDHENVIIQSLSIKEGEGLIPTFEVTLNNEPSASTLERIQGQISEIETSVNNKFSSQSELSKQYRKKLDKVVWDRNLEERVDDNGEEYLFLTKPLVTAYGVTMYASADVQVPSIYEGLPIDGVTIQWVDGKLVATGGKGNANGIVVNGNTYTPNEDGIITLPNYPSLSGYATEKWVNNTLSGYATSSSLSQLSAKVDNFLEGTDTDGIINKWKELESFLAGQTQTSTLAELLSVKADKATTLAGYGITDAYTKNEISGLLSDYVTKSGTQDITGIKSFINGLNIGDILVKKHSDGVVELDGDLILTGSLTMFAQGSHTASTILDALPIDNTTLSKEGGVLSVIGGVGGGSVDGIILNGTTYSPDETTKLITLPNYPTTLPASDVYSWAKQPNKPSYSFSELSSHPTTLGGYGITDAYTQSDADGRFFRYFGYATDDGDDFMWQKLGTFTYLNAFPDGVTIKRHGYGQVTSFIAGSSRFQLYSTHSSSDPNDGPNGIQFRSGWDDDKKSWRMLLDEVNYLHYTDNRYVNKAGDTMTGKLLFNADSGIDLISIPRTKSAISFNNAGSNRIGINFTDGDGNLRIAKTDINQDWVSGNVNILLGSNNYKVWHAGNDGSGSGLDADLLDGYHYYSFESYHKVSIDTTGLDNNTWYPVTMGIDNSLQTRIRVQGNTYAPGSWNGREDKRMSLILDYTVNGSYWGWTSARRVINEIQDGAGAQGAHCIGGLGQLTNSSTEYVYVRGGAVYDFYVDRFTNPVLRTSTYTIQNQSVSPQTSYSDVNRTNALLTDNVASATKLQTPRYIFSKPFDGTNNVTGGAKFNSICIETDNNGNDNERGSEINNYNAELNLQYDTSRDITMCFGGGNVRIGTGISSYKLNVNGDTYCSGKITSGIWIRSDLYSAGIDHYADDSYSAAYNACAPNNDNYCCYSIVRSGTIPLGIGFNTNSEIWLGTVNTNRKAAAQWLQISGNRVTCSGDILAYGGVTMYGSDETKKNIIERFILPLDYVVNAPLWRYTWRDNRNDRINIGGSAQYTQLMMNELVGDSDKGLTMDYATTAYAFSVSIAKHFQRFLIEDFNNHETRIEFLERENKELKDSNKEMMNRIIELERRAA